MNEYIKLDDLQEIECNIDEIDQPNPDNTSIDRISVTNRISEINSINRNPTDVSHSSKLDLDALDSKQKDFKDPDFPSLEPGIRLAPSYEMFDNELEEVLTRKASVSSAFASPSKQKVNSKDGKCLVFNDQPRRQFWFGICVQNQLAHGTFVHQER